MKRGLLTEQEYEEIRRGCQAFDLPLSVDSLNAEDVLAATKKDKKMEAGHIKFILMDGIGKSFIDKTVTDQELLAVHQGDSYMTVNSVKPVWVHWLKGCAIIFILTFLDQGSKYLVLTRLKNSPDIILIPGVLELHYLENRGMAFGMI